jgi:uncharacterized protein YcsI (UPF0317 family)
MSPPPASLTAGGRGGCHCFPLERARQGGRSTAISQAHPEVHGGPVHIGSPAALGIADLSKPDWGEPVRMEPNDVPMFWACGVTLQ